MKVTNYSTLDNNNRVSIQFNRIKKGIKFGDVLKVSKDVIIKVISVDYQTKTIEAKKLQPCIYVWTTESYELNSKYKIGLVNWQSVNTRIEQTDTTGVLEKIELRCEFPLEVYDPKVTQQIESEIHNRIGLSRKDKSREAVQADLKNTIIPTILQIIDEFKVKPSINIVQPTPKYYQHECSLIAANHYKVNDRAWIQWTCGSGKSWGSFWIYNQTFKKVKLNNNLVVFLVPNRQLVVQTHDDWAYISKSYGYDFKSIKIGDVKDSISDVGEISRWIKSTTPNNLNFIISTYQSSHLVGKALSMANVEADMVIYDEVHRLTGEDSKVWKKCLFQHSFPANKRLAMTASPVEYTTSSIGFSGLENEKLFGKKIHTYSFLDAMFDGSIAPMEVKGISLPTDKINYFNEFINKNSKIIQKNMINYDIDISDEVGDVNIDEGNAIFFAQLHNTLMALKNGEITHPVIYANSNARIVRFMATLNAMASDYGVTIDYSNIFSHKDSSIENRVKELNTKFAKSKIGVVGNVYCLQEGISVKEIDSVILIDPRTSGPAITQILGRPVRLNGDNKVAKVYLPIIVKEDGGKMIIDNDYFETTIKWVANLTSSNSDMNSLIFSGGYDAKIMEGIDVRNVVTKTKKPSISGKNFLPKTTCFKLNEVDFTEFKNTAQFKTIISTQNNKNEVLKTKEGKDELIKREACNFVLKYQTKIEQAIDNHNPKMLKKYNELIKNKFGYVEEFSYLYNVEENVCVNVLEMVGLNKLVSLSDSLKKKNIVSSFNKF
jgi:predicted helicase